MFNKLTDFVKRLNANTTDLTNCEKAKKLRKALLIIGGILIVIGAIGIIFCFIKLFIISFNLLDTTLGNSGNTQDVFTKFIPYFVGIIISAVFLFVGIPLFRIGLSILIGGVGSKFVDKAMNNRCSKCGTVIESNEDFCHKCGNQLRYTCSKCGTKNDPDHDYCVNCGNKLDKE